MFLEAYIPPQMELTVEVDAPYIFDSKIADVTGDQVDDFIYVAGNKKSPDAIYQEDITIFVVDGVTNEVTEQMLDLSGAYGSALFIGDFNQNNFLTDKNVSLVKLCDLDNLKIDGLDFDTKHRFVQYYESSDANINNIDSYCFNLFTIAYLNNYDLGYFDYRGPLKLPKELKTKENMDICESMTHLDSSYVPKYLIDNMR